MSEAVPFPIESIRFLDVHPVMPDGSPPELRDSFDSLLAPLLLNSALAALKVIPQTSHNARIAVDCASRALEKMTLSDADKGAYHLCMCHDKHADDTLDILAKALYRRALAYAVLKDEDAAESDLITASQLMPEDQAITGELGKLRQRRKEKKEKEKKAFKKMFA
jgi:peptidyl-prolyl isomerase D